MAAFNARLNYGSCFAFEETDSETEADEGGESGAVAGLKKKMRCDGLEVIMKRSEGLPRHYSSKS